MTHKDRKIQIFTQIFLFLTGCYFLGFNLWKLSSGFWEDGLFEFYHQEMPVFSVAAGMIAGILSLIGFAMLWLRASWAYGFCLFTSGILFSYTLMELAGVIFFNPTHAIPMVLILFVVLQTFPFLMRHTQRQL